MTKRIDRSDIFLYTYPPPSAFQNEAEAWAIETISNELLPLPEDRKLNKGQRELREAFGNKWAIIGWWLVYFRTRSANVRKPPYNLPEFKAQRSYAWLLNKHLDLCAGVFELVNVEEYYYTPLDWFKLHINELKQAENRAILSQLPSLTRNDEIIKAKQDFKQLSAATVPFTKSQGNLHHHRLLTAATLLVRHSTTKERKNFQRDYWEPYLNALEDWIEDLSDVKKYVAARVTERGLEERNKGRPRKELKK